MTCNQACIHCLLVGGVVSSLYPLTNSSQRDSCTYVVNEQLVILRLRRLVISYVLLSYLSYIFKFPAFPVEVLLKKCFTSKSFVDIILLKLKFDRYRYIDVGTVKFQLKF